MTALYGDDWREQLFVLEEERAVEPVQAVEVPGADGAQDAAEPRNGGEAEAQDRILVILRPRARRGTEARMPWCRTRSMVLQTERPATLRVPRRRYL